MSHDFGEVIETESVRVEPDSVVGTLARAETDMQISTAKHYPRSVRRFMQSVRELVTLNEDVAGECIYALPRGGKSIEGPSARFAEVVLSCWGNSHGAARIVGEDDKFVTAQAAVWDLERNVRIAFETRRRITNKQGRRFDDDMIGVTGNAAASIAFRNAVLKVVPKAFWHGLYQEARKVAVGDVKTLANRRASLVEAFGKMGVTEPMILALLEVDGVEGIGLDDLAMLRGVYTAIRDEGQSIESIFNQPAKGTRVGKSDLAPKAKPAEQPPATETTPEEPPVEPEADDVPFEPSEPAVPIAAELAGKLADAETLEAVRAVKAEVKAALRAKKITARQAADLNESIQLREAAFTAE